MKNILKVLLVVSLMGIFTGCSLVEVDEKAQVNPVTAKEVIEKMDNKESFAVVIGDAKCSACVTYLDTLEEFNKKEGILFDYIDLNELKGETDPALADTQKLVREYLDEKFEATPTTYFIKNGSLVEDKVGAMSYKDLKEVYNSHLEIKK